MGTLNVKILKPEAAKKLRDMADEKLIEINRPPNVKSKKKPLRFGSMKGLVVHIADDFDAPLDDFKDYM